MAEFCLLCSCHCLRCCRCCMRALSTQGRMNEVFDVIKKAQTVCAIDGLDSRHWYGWSSDFIWLSGVAVLILLVFMVMCTSYLAVSVNNRILKMSGSTSLPVQVGNAALPPQTGEFVTCLVYWPRYFCVRTVESVEDLRYPRLDVVASIALVRLSIKLQSSPLHVLVLIMSWDHKKWSKTIQTIRFEKLDLGGMNSSSIDWIHTVSVFKTESWLALNRKSWLERDPIQQFEPCEVHAFAVLLWYWTLSVVSRCHSCSQAFEFGLLCISVNSAHSPIPHWLKSRPRSRLILAMGEYQEPLLSRVEPCTEKAKRRGPGPGARRGHGNNSCL